MSRGEAECPCAIVSVVFDSSFSGTNVRPSEDPSLAMDGDIRREAYSRVAIEWRGITKLVKINMASQLPRDIEPFTIGGPTSTEPDPRKLNFLEIWNPRLKKQTNFISPIRLIIVPRAFPPHTPRPPRQKKTPQCPTPSLCMRPFSLLSRYQPHVLISFSYPLSNFTFRCVIGMYSNLIPVSCFFWVLCEA